MTDAEYSVGVQYSWLHSGCYDPHSVPVSLPPSNGLFSLRLGTDYDETDSTSPARESRLGKRSV